MKTINSQITPAVEEILAVHRQLWDHASSITYKGHTATVTVPDHGGYRSAVLNNSTGVPHLWITQNMNKSTYGTHAIARAAEAGERKRITWIINTNDGQFRYVGRIETHEFFDPAKTDRIHIETYNGDDVTVVYTNNPAYQTTSVV